MKVGIIGAGSIGMLFAAYISKIFEVTLYSRTEEQAVEINKNGIVLQKNSETNIIPVTTLPVTKWNGDEDFTIITVKQYQLQSVISNMLHLSTIPENLLFLQNGMGHLEQLEKIPVKNVFVGSVEHGALKENAFKVFHNGDGITNVAVFRGEATILRHFSANMGLGFQVVFQDDYYEMLLNKLIVNAVINPLTAILCVKNGELVENEFYFNTVRSLFSEIASILKLETKEKYLAQIINICKKTADNRSSMLKDIDAKRVTEVDAILGFLMVESSKQGIRAPQVENLYNLIKGKELEKGGFS